MKKLLLFFMMLAMAVPLWAGEKTVTISRNDISQLGVYYCDKEGVTMTFSSGMNNPNYLVEHQQVVFYIRSNNYVIKKIVFHCLDNTTENDLDAFYWGPSTISEGDVGAYTPTGTYTSAPGSYIGTWVGGSVDSKNVAFMTKGRPVRFGSVEITYEKEFGDIFELVKSSDEIAAGNTYALVSKQSSRALGKVENHTGDSYESFSSTPVTLLDHYQQGNIDVYNKVKVTDEVSLIKLERAASTTTTRPWHLKVGDNYIRRRNGEFTSGSGTNKGYNLWAVPNLPTEEFNLYFFRVSISIGTNYNALLKFYHTNSEVYNSSDMAIRHYNGGSLFRVMDSNSSTNSDAIYQRVYLYKPASTYQVTTECLPDDNCGYITLGSGVLTDNQGNSTSQQFDNVTFFVGPTDGYGVGQVIVTNPDDPNDQGTILDPVNTSDFGNDYSFTMPANNVKITANFVAPNNIFTESTPADGGDFNFINGYTDFNGQAMSNAGKRVTFSIEPAEGYSLNSVTYTNNGVTETLTPDENGVYTFTMPGNDVTLTANYTLAPDLYLLGTAMGRTYWVPAGPKFNYDGTNNEYYLDVYFKGIEATGNQFGFFSLARRIDTGITWQTAASNEGNWDLTKGDYRLAAQWNNYEVQAGSTQVPLYAGSSTEDNAFKIPAGVYRIKVNQAMTQMSIEEIPVSLTFTPESGASAMLGESIDVSFTSDLGTIVQGIAQPYGIAEPAATYNYSTTNGNTTSQVVTGNSLTITKEDITTVNATANIGYISVPGTADYEIIGDLYMLGTIMGRTIWAPSGPKFTYDAENEQYYLDVYYTGQNGALSYFDFFSLATHVSDFDWTQRTQTNSDWSQVSGRLAATSDRYPVDGNSVDVPLSNDENATSHFNNSFKIPSGIYRVTVNKAKTLMSITEYPKHITFTPAGGTEENPTIVEPGDIVVIDSDIQSQVNEIDRAHGLAELQQQYHIKDDTFTGADDDWPLEPSDRIVINREGQTTVKGMIDIGFIIVEGTGVYRVNPHSISTHINPEGAGTISITSPTATDNLEIAGQTVTFSVSSNTGYALDGVEVSIDMNGQIVPCTDNGDGTYSFVMPKFDVTINANYYALHTISKVLIPEGVGSIIGQNYADTNETVTFMVGTPLPPYDNYYIYSVMVTNDDTHETITWTLDGHTYSFTMPDNDVTITVVYRHVHEATINWTPVDGGVAGFVMPDGTLPTTRYPVEGTTVTFSVTPYPGFEVGQINTSPSLNVTDNQDGTWSFVMPEAPVTIDVTFVPDGEYQIYLVNDPTDAGSITLSGHVKVENGNFYSDGGQTVVITPVPEYGYSVGDVTAMAANNDPVNVVSNGDGTFSIVMPTSDVTVTVHYNAILPWNITTRVVPEGTGLINLADNQAIAGQTVTFTVTPNTYYQAGEVTVTNLVTQVTTTLTPDGNGQYSFTMPNGDVVIVANFSIDGYQIFTENNPAEGGTIELSGQVFTEGNNNYSHAGANVTVTPSPNFGWNLTGFTVTGAGSGEVTVADIGDGSYSFIMPEANVTVTANYEEAFEGVVFKRVNDVSEIVEGEFYTIVAANYHYPNDSKVLNKIAPDEHFTSTYVVGWASDAYYSHDFTYVILDHNACFFKLEDLTVSNYGRAAYAKTGNAYLGRDLFPDDSNQGYIALYNSRDDVKPFYFTGLLNGGVGSFYDYVDYQNRWRVFYDKEMGMDGTFRMQEATNYTPDNVRLYKPAKVYNITTVVNPNEDAGSLVLGHGAQGSTGAEGCRVTVTPEPNLDEGYALSSLVVTLDGTDQTVDLTYDPEGFYTFIMPSHNVTITATFEPGYMIDWRCLPDEEYGEIVVAPAAVPGHTVTFGVWPNNEFEHAVDSLYITDTDTTVLDIEITQIDDHTYSFVMPSNDVIIWAVFGLNIQEFPLQVIEQWDEQVQDGHNVRVADELIGVWAVKNLLWAKDQSPYKANDYVEIPTDRTDYVRQNMKLQKHDWDQSNWVILEFEQPEDMDEKDFFANVAKYVDHKIEAGTILGRYECDTYTVDYYGNGMLLDSVFYKGRHIIGVGNDPEAWPVVLEPESTTSLGYPGYRGDPREEKPYDYMYNHYLPNNFLDYNIGGVFGIVVDGGVEPGEDPVYDTSANPRFFFMNPKDREVAQVWAVWLGKLKFRDAYKEDHEGNRYITADVFETYEPARFEENGQTYVHNGYDLNGAFFVPDWNYNRLSNDPYDYGKPGENILHTDSAYLFHVAIQTTCRSFGAPEKASMRDGKSEFPLDHLQAKTDEPWSHYQVYPLDLGENSIITGVREIMPRESTEIDSIRYYNIMGQESDVPFDGINIRVIRYKDGSMISKKILR